MKIAERVVRQQGSLPERPRASARTPHGATSALSGRVVLLEAQLPGRFAATPGCFLAGQVADAEVGGVDQEAPPVDQDLRLPRGRLDDRRALQHSRHPDTPTVDL